VGTWVVQRGICGQKIGEEIWAWVLPLLPTSSLFPILPLWAQKTIDVWQRGVPSSFSVGFAVPQPPLCVFITVTSLATV
jgi:hypothetical protein